MSKSTKTPSFEASIDELEKLVNTLESGDLPLEQALSAFEKGVKLTKECQMTLDKAEQQVALLAGEGENLKTVDFDQQNND